MDCQSHDRCAFVSRRGYQLHALTRLSRLSYLPSELVLKWQLSTKESPSCPPNCIILCQASLSFIKFLLRILLCSFCYWLTALRPALLQHSTPFDFPISSESKYLGQERPYSNPPYSTNDYPFSSRRSHGNLTNDSSGTGVAVPANNAIEFGGSSLLNETPP